MTDQRQQYEQCGIAFIRLKIAVAIALIRVKPAGISAKEYTEKLCINWKLTQLRWKQKWEETQVENLHLKQQLVLQSENVTSADTKEEEDVSCFSQNLFPTPPASGSHGNKESTNRLSVSLSKHTTFLSYVINLQKITSNTSFGTDDVIKKSIMDSIKLLEGYIGKEGFSWRVQHDCVECIVLLIDRMESEFQKVLVQKISDLTESIVKEILSAENAQYNIQLERSNLLAKLGSGISTSQSVIDSLLCTVFGFSEDLRNNIINNDKTDPDYFCCMYYVIRSLEMCVGHVHFTQQSEQFKHQVNQKLEDCLMHVTQRFPIFAHALWKICGKINPLPNDKFYSLPN